MNEKKWIWFFSSSFFVLVLGLIFATFFDFFVSYSIYKTDYYQFITRESNGLVRHLFIADVNLVVIFLIVCTCLLVWILFFLYKSTLFVFKHEKGFAPLFCGFLMVGVALLGVLYHIFGAVSWFF